MATRRGGGDDAGRLGSRTQRVPRATVDPSSFEVDIEVAGPTSAEGEITVPLVVRPELIVMEERGGGLVVALERFGFLIRAAQTGFEAMSLVGERMPAAVVVGPGDPERRRILTGALRLRFPSLAVVLVVPAGDPTAGDLSRQDGVYAVLPWPLPSTSEILRAFDGLAAVSSTPPPSFSAPRTVSRPAPAVAMASPPLVTSVVDAPYLTADASATGSMVRPVPAALHSGRAIDGAPPRVPPATVFASSSPVFSATSPVPAGGLAPSATPPVPRPISDDDPDAPTLNVDKRHLAPRSRTAILPSTPVPSTPSTPAPSTPVPSTPARRPARAAAARTRTREAGEPEVAALGVARIELPASDEDDARTTPVHRSAAGLVSSPTRDGRDVVRALAPLVWSLDDCARYLDDLARHEGASAPVASAHAATARAVSRLLAELQVHVDEFKGG